MIADVIDTFKKISQPSIKKLKKITGTHNRKVVMSLMFFKLHHLAAQCSRSLHSKLREKKKQVPATLSHSKN